MLVSIINNCSNLKETMTLMATCLKLGQGQKKRKYKQKYIHDIARSWTLQIKTK